MVAKGSRFEIDPEYRFNKAVAWKEPPDHDPSLGPCLVYLGADNGNGYGQFRYNRRNGYAHRYAWEREHGAIPHGMTIDHLCRVRRCVNVEHMELVSGPENTRRGADFNRARKTRCKSGRHEWKSSPTYPQCPQCKTERERKSTKKYAGIASDNIKYDQQLVKHKIAEIRASETTIAQAARAIGCNPNYLGRRVWNETKADVLSRDSACIMCGVSSSLDVHHRIARGAGGAPPNISFGMSNLIVLCRAHHAYVTEHTVWARDTGGWCLLRSDTPSQFPVLRFGKKVYLFDDGSISDEGQNDSTG